jgi:NDP-sugar pyrophosphorylase family protein
VVVSGHWREVGTPADYLETVQAHLGDATWIDPTARVHPRARLRSCLIGRGSVIGSGTVVEASIVAEGAVVPTGVRVRQSILLGRLTVEPGAIVENAVLVGS